MTAEAEDEQAKSPGECLLENSVQTVQMATVPWARVVLCPKRTAPPLDLETRLFCSSADSLTGTAGSNDFEYGTTGSAETTTKHVDSSLYNCDIG